ncbi:CerR family C-terminal domain-containing protein [Aquibium oceanicum]|uniref:TetR family transcriptional regulator n=1 Tax=Aquibium oceanicum TaxID=1670800 RepID=A0A1L3SMG0_9HYPH|nr:CerR family C-terminal domain-containing protein [Aquibium oceanicum]APH70583.1 TetR family transcriptional regulator [Aquibium oceanicum]
MTTTQPVSAAEQTRGALIQAALRLFGEKGYDGTSTREIAGAARANIGSIAYHFGGKEGLRAACAEFIVETVQAVADQALGPQPSLPQAADPETAQRMLSAGIERMVDFIVARPESGAFVQFILRELAHPTAALDRVYSGVFEPTHRRLCELWERATGEPAEDERTKLTVFTMIGQVVYFRIGREAVMRRMGWSAIGPVEAGKIVETARFNLEAVLAARGRQKQ